MTLIEPSGISAWVQVALGLALLFLGRKLFWVFVGVFGFLAGVQIAPTIVRVESSIILLVIALVCGLVGALLAVVLQRVAVAIAGWIAGAYLAFRFATAAGWEGQTTLWIIVIIGAVLAAIIVSLLFDWALIVFSALTGAIIVSDAVQSGRTVELTIAVVLFALGAMTQARSLERRN